MNMHESEKERASSAFTPGVIGVFRWIRTRPPRKCFQAIMVMAIMAGPATAHIREAYGQGPEALYYAMAVTSGESDELTPLNCEKLREALKNPH
jgi:hypothetical protein